MAMTITEALAEIKTIGKRLEKKRQAVLSNLARDSRLKDPLEDSTKFIASERQAIEDLEKRWITIRTAIQKSNLVTTATVGDNTMTVQEWLNFRREIASSRQMFLASINTGISQIRVRLQREHPNARVMAAAAASATVQSGEAKPIEILLHLDEKELLADQEGLEKTLGDLDGKLSLLNATTVIEV